MIKRTHCKRKHKQEDPHLVWILVSYSFPAYNYLPFCNNVLTCRVKLQCSHRLLSSRVRRARKLYSRCRSRLRCSSRSSSGYWLRWSSTRFYKRGIIRLIKKYTFTRSDLPKKEDIMSEYFTAPTNIYLEYTVSVPSSELAPPAPYPASECVPPWNHRGGRAHSLGGEGVERSWFGRLEKKPITLSTVWLHLCCRTQSTYCTVYTHCVCSLVGLEPPTSSRKQ